MSFFPPYKLFNYVDYIIVNDNEKYTIDAFTQVERTVMCVRTPERI